MPIKKRIVLEGPPDERRLEELLAAARGLGYLVVEAADANDDDVTVTARNTRLGELLTPINRERVRLLASVGLGDISDIARLTLLETWRRLRTVEEQRQLGPIAAHMAANHIEFTDCPATPCSDAYALFKRDRSAILPELSDIDPRIRSALGDSGVLYFGLLKQLRDEELRVKWISPDRGARIRAAITAYNAQHQA